MTRAHLEFIQAQRLDWQASPWSLLAGTECKILSQDEGSGAVYALIRYPTGWSRHDIGYVDAAEESLVLDGELRRDGQLHAQHCYTRLPAGYPRHDAETVTGAVVLTFFDHEPRWRTGDPPAGRYDLSGAEPLLDAFEMPWECAGMDPVYASSGLRWKMLRGQIGDADTTMLVYCPPHLHPPQWRGPQEVHDCVEEMFLISGDYLSNVGTMHEGAYFWRPPGIAHGPYGTRSGNLALIRTLGAALLNNWTSHEFEISRSPPLRPYLPPELSARGKPWQPEAY